MGVSILNDNLITMSLSAYALLGYKLCDQKLLLLEVTHIQNMS